MTNTFVLDISKQSISKSPKMPFRETKGSLQWLIDNYFKEEFKRVIEDFKSTEAQGVGALQILDEMTEGFNKADNDIDRIIEELQKLKPSIKKHLTNIHQKAEVLRNNMASAQQENQRIREFKAKLQNTTDYLSAGNVTGDAEKALQSNKENMKELQRLLQENEKERQQLEKVCFKFSIFHYHFQ